MKVRQQRKKCRCNLMDNKCRRCIKWDRQVETDLFIACTESWEL